MSKHRKLIDRESTISGLITDAFSELTTLGEEMREAFDNTPESLQSAGVGERRGEAADALENLNEPEVPEIVAEIVVKWQEPPPKRRMSRSDRRSDATCMLEQAIDAVENWLNENDTHDQHGEVEAFRDELESQKDEADSVEFPGMYG